ncbi:MAG: YegP family protein [Agarilytica sp.]
MNNAKFEIFTGNDNHYYFRLKAGNGETIGISEGYRSKQGASNGMRSVKENAPYDFNYTIFIGRDDRYYFNLKAGNGEIILRSQGYATKSGAIAGKDSVKQNAPTASTLDLTALGGWAYS